MARKKGSEYWDRIVANGQKYVDQDDRQQINDWLERWGGIFCGVVIIGFVVTLIVMMIL
ncbi:hypothetical protein [Brevibacterium aurantiacum]|uniref:Uncharacterized protein n=1 Tax=Brevibacterium aurantiacum TaxID=273384 RepID=A0A2H1HV52_BREAU|nr:hypothetical protein [Brevibacterium aurantiacum]SMX66787.1 hypothetical protein BAUR920_00291 [Brevibacterium aurantiacum]